MDTGVVTSDAILRCRDVKSQRRNRGGGLLKVEKEILMDKLRFPAVDGFVMWL